MIDVIGEQVSSQVSCRGVGLYLEVMERDDTDPAADRGQGAEPASVTVKVQILPSSLPEQKDEDGCCLMDGSEV